MRQRVQDDTTSANVSDTAAFEKTNNNGSHSCDTGNIAKHSFGFPYPTGTYREMSDVVIPNFRQRSAKGEIFVNPMYSHEYTRSYTLSDLAFYVPYTSSTPGSQRYCSYYYEQKHTDSCLCIQLRGHAINHIPSKIDGMRLRTLAGTDAAARVADPVFQGLVFLGELRETIGFIRNPLKAVHDYLYDVRKFKRRKKKYAALTTTDYLANQWLSYRYGLMPLVFDVQDAAKAIQRTVDGFKPVRETSRGMAQDQESLSSADSPSGDTYVISEVSTNRKVSVRAGVLYEYTRSPDTFGVGLREIPNVIWEIIPYSFVADWFVNINSYIDAIVPVAGIRKLGSWTTVREEATTQGIHNWYSTKTASNGANRVVTQNGTTVEDLSSKSTTRTPGLSVGLASRVAPLSGDIGKKRVTDLLALIRQLLASK
jgi:hypothetical protein